MSHQWFMYADVLDDVDNNLFAMSLPNVDSFHCQRVDHVSEQCVDSDPHYKKLEVSDVQNNVGRRNVRTNACSRRRFVYVEKQKVIPDVWV